MKGNEMEHVWPFPPPTGPIPWTPAQEKAYQRKRIQDAEEAPW